MNKWMDLLCCAHKGSLPSTHRMLETPICGVEQAVNERKIVQDSMAPP